MLHDARHAGRRSISTLHFCHLLPARLTRLLNRLNLLNLLNLLIALNVLNMLNVLNVLNVLGNRNLVARFVHSGHLQIVKHLSYEASRD